MKKPSLLILTAWLLHGFPMAGFQPTLYGRLWVTPEVLDASSLKEKREVT
jgi:hypothetical protein